jgi:hypothetical protein
MLIEDGQGSGRTAGVSTENRLKTIAVTSSTEHHINHDEGLAFNLIFQQTPAYDDPSNTTGDVCFLYIQNTHEGEMVLEGIDLRLGGTGQTEIIKVIGKDSGTQVGGSDISPANLNLGSGKTADGVFKGGDEITGLSGGVELQRIYISSSDTTSHFNFEQDIIVPKNNLITLYATNLDTEIDGTLVFNYHSTTVG